MTRPPRTLSLTPALVASVERMVPDAGSAPGLAPLAEDEYRKLAGVIMNDAGGVLHVFAYGSLIWKPEAGFMPVGRARAHGWRRSFCLSLTAYRGTPDQPGLMLALDRGGCCDGVLMRADDAIGLDQVEALLRREIESVDDVSCMRWITVRHGAERVRALAFYAGLRSHGIAVYLPLEEQARRIARAAGSLGTCAAYLHNTIVNLIEHGIDDAYLWKLQALVAEEIRAAAAAIEFRQPENLHD